jgi:hypothetical protein
VRPFWRTTSPMRCDGVETMPPTPRPRMDSNREEIEELLVSAGRHLPSLWSVDESHTNVRRVRVHIFRRHIEDGVSLS